MKRFSKTLTLILVLIAILTAFTVVALADEPEDPSAVKDPGGFSNLTFENDTVGSNWGTSSGNDGYGGGITIAEAYPGGNKYLRLVYSSLNPNTNKDYVYTRYSDLGGGNNSHRAEYVFKNYPTVAIDFDIMTENGNWGYYKSDNNSTGLYIRHWDVALGGSGKSGSALISNVTFGQIGLATTPYLWQHVTVVYEYSTETVDDVTTEYLSMKVYVNGALTKTIADKKEMSGSGNYYVGPLYIKTSRYTLGDIIGLDNINFTYFKEGYDTSKIPTLIYNSSWNAPFGKVAATVTSGDETTYYDSFDKAYAYASAKKDATTVQLYANTTASIVVDNPNVTIDARKRDSEGNLTGENYTFSYTETTTKGYYLEEVESGIYKVKKIIADFMITTSAGVTTYHMADEFDAKFKALTGSATLKLLNNIETTAFITTSGSARAFTLDLNGYELRRIEYYGDVYEATGDEEYPSEPNGTATTSSGTILFYTPSSGGKVATLTITSTAETKGKIYNVVAKTNTYIRDGVVERREILKYDSTGMVTTQTTGSSYTFSNVDVYATVFAYTDYGNRNVTYKLDNVNFYQMSPPSVSDVSGNATFLFYLGGQAGMTVHATDCLFYMNAAVPADYIPAGDSGSTGLIRFSKALDTGYTTDVKFTNCDIIGADGKYPIAIMNSQQKENIIFDGCRFHNIQNSSISSAISTNGTIATSGTYPVAMSGYEKLSLTSQIKVAYDVPAVDMWTATADAVQSVDFNFGTKEQVCTFTIVTTKEIDVTINGNTVKLTPGISELYTDKSQRVYADTTTDAFLNKIYLICDKNGNAYESILGVTDKGVQLADWENAVLTTSDTKTGYVGGIKDTNFNLTFLTGFRYNLYLPVDARLTEISVDGFTKSDSTVYIDGTKYLVFTYDVGTAEAAAANVINATYKVDGISYSQSWSINAVQYAELLIAYPEYASEKATVGNMVKFIKEAVLATDSNADVSSLNSIITSAGLELTYGSYTEGNVNSLGALGGAITGMRYIIHSGVASYKFITPAADTPLTFKTASGEAIGFTRATDEEDGYHVILDSMRVYDIIKPITIISGGATTEFSMLDYLTAMNTAEGIEIAKALYEFGLAAETYRMEMSGFKSTFDYTVRGLNDGDHIVVAAEPSRKIKVIDPDSSIDPDTLKNLALTNVEKIVFKVDGKTVGTVTEAPFEFNLVFESYGEHTLTIEVYDTDGFVSQKKISYTALDHKFDDTFLSFEENFDGDADGTGLTGGASSLTTQVVNGALQIGDGQSKGDIAFHPYGRSLPKENEVYYIEFDFATNSTAYHTRFTIRDGYQSGSSAELFNFTNDFTKNKTYHIEIILDFYSNYATMFVDGEYYIRASMAAQTGDVFVPQLFVNKRIVTIDNVKFSSYGYNIELPEPTYSEEAPVVILKLDDFGKSSTLDSYNNLLHLFEEYGITGGFGLIGSYFDELTEDEKQKVVNAVEKYTEAGIEIWHHGYLHSTTEYNANGGDDYETQKANFGKTMDIAKNYFGITIRSFGSPYNHAGDTAIRMIQENYPEITNYMFLRSDPNGIANLPIFNEGCAIESETGVLDAAAFIANFESQKATGKYLVVQGHPNSWDDNELSQLELIIRYLLASGVTFMTPAEAAEDVAKNKTYEILGIEDGDRIVSAYESERKIKVADQKPNEYAPVAGKSIAATLVSKVEFYVDGVLAYTVASAPYEYTLTFGSYGDHTLEVVITMTTGNKRTYTYSYKVLEATENSELTVLEDFSAATDASAIHGGTCDSGMVQTVTDGVLQLTASGSTYYMNMYPDVSKLTVLDRIYFMEYDIAVDSKAYASTLSVHRIMSRNGGDYRDFVTINKNYDYTQTSSKVWYNVKIMFDPGNDSAIIYIDGCEYKRVNLAYLTNIFFRPELSVNRKNVYLDNYKFYAYDLAEKEEVKAPTVILRFDDLRDSSIEEFDRAIAILNKYGIDASCGVIGSGLGSQELYDAIIRYYEGGAEIWHHGYAHDSNEYYSATAESVIKNFGKTLELIKENCGIDITSFGAPYNRVDSAALKVIQENFEEIKVVMASEDKSDVATIVNFHAIMTFEGENESGGKIDLEGFKEAFENYKHNEYITIYCHPGSWKNVDYETFDQLIQYLISEGVTFMTPTEAADHYLADQAN